MTQGPRGPDRRHPGGKPLPEGLVSSSPIMLRSLFLVLASVLAVFVAPAAGAPKPPHVLIVSDVLGDVPDSLRPQPGKPIHYVIIGKVENDLGTPIAGEPRADPAVIEREVVKVLASQGFLPTAVGGPMPALAILITWGSAVLDTSEISMPPLPQPSFGAPADPTALPPPPPPDTVLLAYNQREIASLVGADKANRNLLDSSRLAAINDAASTSRVYIFIGAFDIETMLKKKQRKLLWRTRMSIPSTHHSLPDSIGIMLASAAPFLGREVAAPVFIGESDRRKAEVQMGTPYVVPEPAKAKAGKKAR